MFTSAKPFSAPDVAVGEKAAAVQKFSISLKNSCRVSSWFGRNEPSS